MPFPSVPFLDMAHPHPGQRGRPFSRRSVRGRKASAAAKGRRARPRASNRRSRLSLWLPLERKPLASQPSQTQSPNQAQGWLNKGILHSAGVCLGVLVWRDYFAPKRDGTSVDMSNRASISHISRFVSSGFAFGFITHSEIFQYA